MILDESQLEKYLHNEDGKLVNLWSKTVEKLVEWRNTNAAEFTSIVDFLTTQHHVSKKSLRTLETEIGISYETISKIFCFYEIPTRTQTEATEESWKDEDFRKRIGEGLKNIQKSPEYLKRRSTGMKKKWKDATYRRRQLGLIRNKWKDATFRQRQANAAGESWKDEDFRKRYADGVRRSLADVKNAGKHNLKTIHGTRNDIGYYTQSTWESNIARIFLYLGRETIPQVPAMLIIPEDKRELFGGNAETQVCVDFIVQDNRGNIKAYEIMASHYKNKRAWTKIELLAEQHELPIRIITERMYHRIEKRFKDRINNSSDFTGWETYEDNLRTNPKKYE